MPRPYDLAIVGLGPAGLAAARLAANELGLRVAAVERSRVGGDCLWSGCVPSKSFIASAGMSSAMASTKALGLIDAAVAIDAERAWQRISTIRDDIAASETDVEHVRDWGVDVMVGSATITGPRRVLVSSDDGDTEIESRFILIATGSRPAIPSIPGIGDIEVLTNDSLFDLDSPPPSLTVIGAGPVGVETAQSMRRLGIPVTIFDAAPRILMNEEPELTERLLGVLRREGLDIHLGEAVTGLQLLDDGGIGVETPAGEYRAEHLMVATGRSADVAGLGLERIGVVATANGVSVDARSRTIVPNVYAVGDAAAGRPRLTSTAIADAALAVRDMFLPGRAHSTTLAPWCVFADPELAHVGFTAAQARDRFGERSVQVHRLELSRVARARIDGATDGMLMLITARNRIVGGHVLAAHASEVINEIALAIRFSLGLDELAQVPHVYPTLASGLSQIVEAQRSGRIRRFRQIAKIGRITG